MSYNLDQGIAICTFNRQDQIVDVINAVLTTKPSAARVVICDDGSTDDTVQTIQKEFPTLTILTGPNLGVGANKNRALYALRNYNFVCILEDDLVPTQPEWFEMYQEFCLLWYVECQYLRLIFFVQ